MAYIKPLSPIKSGEDFIYPLTSYDQIIMEDGSRWDGKMPVRYLSTYNLLDNSDFRNPVAQAGFVGNHGTETYIIDRWRHLYNLGTATQGVNGIKISGADFYMQQRIDATHLIGKTLTMAVCIDDGHVICGSFVLENLSDSKLIAAEVGLYLMLVDYGFAIRLDGNWEHTLIWAALYEGEYTAETLPPYVPKGYAVELAECQRYYIHEVGSFTPVCYTSSELAYMNVSTPVKMRITPTAILLNADNLVANVNGENIVIPVLSVSTNTLQGNSVSVLLTINWSEFRQYQMGMSFLTSFSLSADL